MEASKVQFKSIDEYIASFPREVGEKLQIVREAIKEAAPEAQETISYNMPAFTYRGNLVYLSAYKKHLSLYPTTEAMEEAMPEVLTYKSGKGTLQFSFDQPLPLPFIRKVVEFRVHENTQKDLEKKQASKAKKKE